MSEFEKLYPTGPGRGGDGPDPDAEADALDAVRSRTSALIESGAATMRHVLSGNSESYKIAMRQEGGQ
jgi:hypothetical protein